MWSCIYAFIIFYYWPLLVFKQMHSFKPKKKIDEFDVIWDAFHKFDKIVNKFTIYSLFIQISLALKGVSFWCLLVRVVMVWQVLHFGWVCVYNQAGWWDGVCWVRSDESQSITHLMQLQAFCFLYISPVLYKQAICIATWSGW